MFFCKFLRNVGYNQYLRGGGGKRTMHATKTAYFRKQQACMARLQLTGPQKNLLSLHFSNSQPANMLLVFNL
jgi:hypothetical protein